MIQEGDIVDVWFSGYEQLLFNTLFDVEVIARPQDYPGRWVFKNKQGQIYDVSEPCTVRRGESKDV